MKLLWVASALFRAYCLQTRSYESEVTRHHSARALIGANSRQVRRFWIDVCFPPKIAQIFIGEGPNEDNNRAECRVCLS